jgi:carbon storage regulator
VSVDVVEAQHSLDTKGLVMLVLSRKPGERILIGDNVAVTIVRIGPNSVRLGIDAPRDMNIVREELCMPSAGNGGQNAPATEASVVVHGM